MEKSGLSIWKNIKSSFLSASGEFVLFATIISRLASFFGAWLALQLIDHDSLGQVIYAYQIIIFVVPFIGVGLHQGLLRYGAKLSKEGEKMEMFAVVIKKGFIGSLLLATILYLLSNFITTSMPASSYYLKVLSLVIPVSFLYEIIRTQFRILHQNKQFAFTEITYALLLILLIAILSTGYGAKGYAWAFVLAPVLSFAIWMPQLKRFGKGLNSSFKITGEIWRYGIYASLGSVTTQLLYVIDILLIGNLLLDSEQITIYKYLTLVPFSIIFLSQVFMTTHFVDITKNMHSKKYITDFIKKYHYLFFVICVLFLAVSWFLKDYILWLFDASFVQYSSTFMILCIGSAGILLVRGLYGNLLSALGFANFNFWISLVGLALNVFLNLKWIPIYGIHGAAMTSSIIMWVTAIVSMLSFYWLYRNRTHSN